MGYFEFSELRPMIYTYKCDIMYTQLMNLLKQSIYHESVAAEWEEISLSPWTRFVENACVSLLFISLGISYPTQIDWQFILCFCTLNAVLKKDIGNEIITTCCVQYRIMLLEVPRKLTLGGL